MKDEEKKAILNNVNDAESSAPGERIPDLVDYKRKLGLPKWSDLSKELAEIAKRHDISWANELQAKIELHRKYVEYQTLLTQNFMSMGMPQVNAIHNVMDLQNKLFELEEKLRSEGTNPLESDEWMRARDMLAKEMQFIHKHKLDIAQFQANLQAKKNRMDDDNMFVVEAEEVKE